MVLAKWKAIAKWMLRRVPAAVMILAGGGAHAEASYSETVRLVRSMREDELFMAGLQSKLAEEVKAGKAPRYAACLAKVRYPLFTDAIALGISSQLTDAEVAEGIEFFRSALGRKLLDQSYRGVMENRPLDMNDFTTEETIALAKFGQRPAGRKLLQDRITHREAVMSKANIRWRVAVEDCEAVAGSDTGAPMQPESCKTAPLVSPDNACSVEQQFTVYPQPGSKATTSVLVNCLDRAEMPATYDGRVDGIGLKWLDAKTVEVAAPRGAKLLSEGRGGQFRAQFKQLPAAGGKQQCWKDTLAVNSVPMDELQSQPFWMSYGDEERCILSKRLDKAQLPGAQRDALVQFRRVKADEYPFATRQLVFFERFSVQAHTRAVRIRGTGGSVLELQPGGPKAGFHLIGAPAEEVLKQLVSGADLTLEVQPAVGDAFVVQLSKADFAWAHAGFEACLQSL